MKYPEKTYTIKASAIRGAKRSFGKNAKNGVDFEIGIKKDGTFYFLPIEKETNVVSIKAPVKKQSKKEPVKKQSKKEPVKKQSAVNIVNGKRTYNRGAVDYCWDVFEAMEGRRRKDVVAFCVNEGINIHTAKTQYQKWFSRNKPTKFAAIK